MPACPSSTHLGEAGLELHLPVGHQPQLLSLRHQQHLAANPHHDTNTSPPLPLSPLVTADGRGGMDDDDGGSLLTHFRLVVTTFPTTRCAPQRSICLCALSDSSTGSSSSLKVTL